jgi:glycosyltransferase involved in cell wall biosynthesis
MHSTANPYSDRQPIDLRPLRVLVVAHAVAGVGGMQQHTHDLVRGLVEAGHDVEVICPAGGGIAPDLHGARWSLLDVRGNADARWAEAVVAAFEAADTRAAFDIVHSESGSALPLVRRGIATPITIMYHGNYLGLAKAHVRRAAEAPRTAAKEGWELGRLTWQCFRHGDIWAFRRCDAMVVSRQQLPDTARSTLTPRQRVHVVPNGVDVSFFRPRDRSDVRRALGIPDGFLLSSAGRLNREKGFDIALEALARVSADVPEVRLLVVGGGEERVALEALARSLGVSDRTLFVGAQPQERVAEYLAASDAFLFPTRRDEAGPLVLPQAMACGLPVIASRIGGIAEVLEPSGGPSVGLLVRPGNAADVEAAIRRLLDDPGLRASVGTAARERVVSEYTVEVMVARTVAVYRTAIARAT